MCHEQVTSCCSEVSGKIRSYWVKIHIDDDALQRLAGFVKISYILAR